jgi:hypothetical protein
LRMRSSAGIDFAAQRSRSTEPFAEVYA